MAERSFSRLERTAYHEAGHAVMGFLMKRRVVSVSIAPLDDGSRGRCNYARTDPRLLQIDGEPTARQRRAIERLIMCSLAGVLAERLATGVDNAISKDWPRAKDHAKRVTASDREADAYVGWLRVRAEELLAQGAARAMVAAVAQALLHDGPELSGARARRAAMDAGAGEVPAC